MIDVFADHTVFPCGSRYTEKKGDRALGNTTSQKGSLKKGGITNNGPLLYVINPLSPISCVSVLFNIET